MPGNVEEVVNVPRTAALQYRDSSGAWSHLPDWAIWLIDVGSKLSALEADHRTWVGISVPDRRYCAALLALGAAWSDSARLNPGSVGDRFADLEVGSGLTWTDANGCLRSGRFQGVDGQYLVYRRRDHQAYGGETRRSLMTSDSVFPMADDEQPFAGPRELTERPAFVEGLLGPQYADDLARSTTMTTICGVVTQLTAELTAIEFACDGEVGSLLEIVRPRELLPQGQRWRTRLIPSSNRLDPQLSAASKLVVFDGPQSYLRLRDAISGPICVLLLSRWEARSVDAAMEASAQRAFNSVESSAPELGDAPHSIELAVWAEEV